MEALSLPLEVELILLGDSEIYGAIHSSFRPASSSAVGGVL